MTIRDSIVLGMAIVFVFILLCSSSSYSQVNLPQIFSDNMVLQREVPVKIWGTASARERVLVKFQNQEKQTRADRNGYWSVVLDPLAAGGPFELKVSGSNTLTFSNILVGDVWIGSGQSNMEWPVNNSADPEWEISQANHPEIRLFTVPRRMSTKPLQDLDGGEWLVCTPENIENFSAVAYYFGRHLHRELDIPIGLINSSWGGTVAETWISHESISSHNDFAETIKHVMDLDMDLIEQQARQRLQEWNTNAETNDVGRQQNWHAFTFDHSGWPAMNLPVLWEQAGLPGLDGVVWFRKEITLSAEQASQNMILNLGPVDDSDYTYMNGHLVGKTLDQYNVNRRYEIPSTYLKEGKNIIAVRVIDTGGGGGIWGEERQLYYLSGNERMSLAGNWHYAVGVEMDAPTDIHFGPNIFPSLLYNGMIKALTPFALRGVIWYQGESNASRAYQYRTLFPLLIEDWRKQWNQPQMPFLFVQLANFMQPDMLPVDSEWAELREAQSMTLSVPFTGMAVAIDIGEADDIHPKNKQDAGKRLALAALKISYGKDIVHSGPVYESMETKEDCIYLTFSHTGSGLKARSKYGYLKGFAIAGPDRVFHWARAEIQGNRIRVYHPDIKNPVAVRYAWGNNPADANLYNIEGLPASPFRTDSWPGITEGR